MKFWYGFIILNIIFDSSFSQNIYDSEHSIIYAEHLYQTEEYEQAYEEYERVLRLIPDSLYFKERLIFSYFNAGAYEKCTQRILDIFGQNALLYPENVILIYLQILLIQEDYHKAEMILHQKNAIPYQERQSIKLGVYILQKKYNDAEALKDSVKQDVKKHVCCDFDLLVGIYESACQTDYKKPIVASMLSVIIPGAGKAYSEDVQNGIKSFTIIGLYTWQSFRAFKHDGIKSIYGWGFGALASGFYAANIFGSYQSAKRTNAHKDKQIQKEVQGIIIKKDFSDN
jgi:hypothetical protein